jgi:hypothetical protein
MKLFNLKIPVLVVVIAVLTACDNSKQPTGSGSLSETAAELGKDSNYTLFAAALAAASITDPADSYTVFALPDSIVKIDGDAMSADEALWHIVRGKYAAADLLQAQTLQTVGGQTLKVEKETAEIDGETQTLFYINEIPVNFNAVRQTDGNIAYSIGSNIAKISNPPNSDNAEAYSDWAARRLEGVWTIEEQRRTYNVWSVSGREAEPFERTYGQHIGCREIFKRNATYADQGIKGTFESRHSCGAEYIYYQKNPHYPEGWWKVDATPSSYDITFYSNITGSSRPTFNSTAADHFSNSEKKLTQTITFTTGRGDTSYYGGEDDVIIGVFYETVYTLKKVSQTERF